MQVYKRSFILFLVILLFSFSSYAAKWESHLEDIQDLERNIYKFQQEMDVLVEKKKNTRERARIEQTLQRIVEIHAELISLRKSMDNIREHLRVEHPAKAHILDKYDSRMFAVKKRSEKYRNSPVSRQLDDLLLKVQIKYAHFIGAEVKKEEMLAVEKDLEIKHKSKKEREADVYLRKKSKIRLVK